MKRRLVEASDCVLSSKRRVPGAPTRSVDEMSEAMSDPGIVTLRATTSLLLRPLHDH